MRPRWFWHLERVIETILDQQIITVQEEIRASLVVGVLTAIHLRFFPLAFAAKNVKIIPVHSFVLV
jgi:hypothetical protein